jgi:5-methylcytosine-specific restriction endonuclease McrA
MSSEAKRAYDAARYARLREEKRAYYEAHREERAAYQKAYNVAHRAEINARSSVYYVEHRAEREADRARRDGERAAYWESHQEEIDVLQQANRKRIAAYQVAYRAAHGEERHAYHAARYAADPEGTRASLVPYQLAWREDHRAELAAYTAAWRAAHPEERREQDRKHSAKRRGAALCEHPACLALGATALAWQTSEPVCWMCGTPVWPGVNLHMDHVIPLAAPHFGLHCAENLRPACAGCNRAKGARLVA